MVRKIASRFQPVVFPLILLAVIWSFSPGIPVMHGPGAAPADIAAGQSLFTHVWAVNDKLAHGDGLGPVYNARSCAECHSLGGLGGAGDVTHNVAAFEIHPNTRDGRLRNGLVHAFAIEPAFVEDDKKLHDCFPIIPGGERLIGGCQVKIGDFNPVNTSRVNSIALFGAGWVDRIDGKAIRYNHTRRLILETGREVTGDFATVSPGRVRILPDGRVGKFGWKAQFATVEEFVAAACANELGLGNPVMQQASPIGSGYKCQSMDLNKRQLGELAAFVSTLPRPQQVLPADDAGVSQVKRGEELFASIGCAGCHTPDLGGVKGVYSDFCLHRLTTPENDGYRHEILVESPLPASHPIPPEWKTPPLWGVADSAPYMHDGSAPTLAVAIARHQGDAVHVTKRYDKLPGNDQQAILAFLRSLKAPAVESPQRDVASVVLR